MPPTARLDRARLARRAVALVTAMLSLVPLTARARAAAPDTMLTAQTQRAHQRFIVGRSLERSHSPAAAIVAYRQAVALDPSIPEANYRMGLLFLSVQQDHAAAECFAQEVLYHPEHLDARRQLGLAYARLGRGPAAVAQLEKLTLDDAGSADDWAALGFAYMAASRAGAADSAMARAIALRPGSSALHRDRGAALAALGRNAEARREYRLAIQLDPRDPTPWINLGNLERRERRPEAALTDYRAAAIRAPASALAVEGQAAVLRDMGRASEAGEVYRRWLSRRPDDHGARLDAVKLYDDLGRKDIALELARGGVRADANSPDARLILGMALQSAGDWRGGLAELRRSERLFTREADRGRVALLIVEMRGQAPDSLREFFTADSLAHLDVPAKAPAGGSR